MIASWDWRVAHQNDDPDHPIMVISTSFSGGHSGNCAAVLPAMTRTAADAVSAGDDMPAGWEVEYFSNIERSGSGDFDGAGLDDLAEYRAGTLPDDADSGGEEDGDGDEAAAGNDPLSDQSYPATVDALGLPAFFVACGLLLAAGIVNVCRHHPLRSSIR